MQWLMIDRGNRGNSRNHKSNVPTNREKNIARGSDRWKEIRRAELTGWRTQISRPLPSDLTVWALFVDHYVAALEDARSAGDGSPSTVRDALSIGELYFEETIGPILVSELTSAAVIALIKQIRAVRSPKPLAPKYIRKIYSLLRTALGIARARGLITSNPAADLPVGVLPENETRPGFDPALWIPALDTLIGLLGDRTFPIYRRLFWALLAFTGARAGEVIALTLADVDRRARPLWSLAITKSFCAKTHTIVTTKTRQHKVAPAHAGLLVPLIEEQIDTGFPSAFGRAMELGDYLISHPDRFTGKPVAYPDNTALRHWKAAQTAHGLPPSWLHILRHFFDSTLDELGADPIAVEEITHPPKRRKKGVRIYRHVSYQRRCKAVSTFPGQLDLLDP